MGGIGVTTVGEAEVFSDSGFNDILIANEIVTRPSIRRLCALAQLNRISVAVDSPQNVSSLSEGATEARVVLQVLVDIDAGQGSCGVAPGAPALDLARLVARSPGLDFGGLMAQEGELPHPDREKGAAETFGTGGMRRPVTARKSRRRVCCGPRKARVGAL